MRIFTVVCRREDTPNVKYVRFLLETEEIRELGEDCTGGSKLVWRW